MEETRYYGSVSLNVFWAYGEKYSHTPYSGVLFAEHSPKGIPAIHKEEDIAKTLDKVTEAVATLIVLSWGNNK